MRSDRSRVVELGDQLGQRRDVVVALDHRRDRADMRQRVGVQRPDGVGHRLVVGIDDVVAVVGVAGQMDLLHPIGRDAAPERQS